MTEHTNPSGRPLLFKKLYFLHFAKKKMILSEVNLRAFLEILNKIKTKS